MPVETLVEADAWDAGEIATLANAAFAGMCDHLGLGRDAEVALLACDDARIAALNADFRGKPQPTNVLSWPSEERATPGHAPALPDLSRDPELGDVAIARETCAREADAQGKPFADHVSHLLVHGMLHLLGYDHESAQDAALMERAEVEILEKLGIPDPY